MKPQLLRRSKRSAGQVSIEMVLMLVVATAIIAAVIQGFQSNEVFANMVSGPWQALSGLIQNGVLGSPASTVAKHPNQFSRVSSPRADPAKTTSGSGG